LEAAESERQRTEEALRQSEERLKRVLETLPVGVWIADEEGTITHGNPAGQQIWAGARYIGPEQFGEYKAWWLHTGKRVEPEEWGVARAISKGEVSLEEEIEIECFDGTHKIVLNWAVPILGPNQEIKGAVAVNQDITERVRAEEELRQSKNELQALFDHMSNGFAYHKIVTDEAGVPVDYIFLDVNKAFERCTGLERERIIGKRATEVHSGIEDIEFDWIGVYGEVALDGEPLQFEQYFEPQGRWYSIVAYAPVRGYFAVTFEDITARRQAVEALRASEEKYRELVEALQEGIWRIDKDAFTTFVNRRMAEMLGYSVDEMLGKHLFEFMGARGVEIATRKLERRQQGIAEQHDFEFIRKDGTRIYASMETTPITDEEGNYVGALAGVMDITERVRAEEKLRQSEARWRSLTETSPDHILTLDTDLNIQFVNFASPGLTVQKLIGTPLYQYAEKERQAEIKAILQGVLRTGQDASYETVYCTPDGWTIHYESRAAPRRLPGSDEIIGLTLSARDITARVRMEERLRASLKEKEALLRELYHRTKNNMQVISSMLTLQAMRIQDKGVLSIFRDVENRIQSMALVHQKLYQSQDLSRIDLKEYIANLVELLMQSYQVPLDKIAPFVDVERALVLIDTAIPCGLILNELLSNVFKHAFPGDRSGEVKIRLRRAKDGTLTLQVSDDGVGFPKDLDWRKSDTLGLQTVFGIAERQLRGKVSVETAHGVTWHIRFREGLYSPRV
jgi:PAS domain S-box-containing protein